MLLQCEPIVVKFGKKYGNNLANTLQSVAEQKVSEQYGVEVRDENLIHYRHAPLLATSTPYCSLTFCSATDWSVLPDCCPYFLPNLTTGYELAAAGAVPTAWLRSKFILLSTRAFQIPLQGSRHRCSCMRHVAGISQESRGGERHERGGGEKYGNNLANTLQSVAEQKVSEQYGVEVAR